MKDMSDIWDDLYEVKCAEDVEDLLDNIASVLQKGIPKADQIGFEELQENLQEFLDDINTIRDAIQSRIQYKEISKAMLEKYGESEFDFEVLPILEAVISDIKRILDEKEQKWIADKLTLGDKRRSAVHQWKEKSRFLPEYLSEETIVKAKKLDQEADAIISKGKNEDVIFYFDKLDEAEKWECIQQLQGRMKG